MAARVLIIDDETIYSKSIALYLTTGGYHAITREGGLVALSYLAENPDIDLILLDLMMPDIYGLEVLAEIKQNPQLQHIPVILQTGMLNESEIQRGLKMGAVSCLRKPFKRQDLLHAVAEALQSKQSVPTEAKIASAN